MSRIGKNPVAIPQGVEIQLSGQTLTAKGRLGALSLLVSNEVTATVADGSVTVTPNSESKQSRAMWGTTRALVNNMVTGVATGFTRTLEINGVGYRAAKVGENLVIQVGYSHPVEVQPPGGISFTVDGVDPATKATKLSVSGIDKQLVGEVAAQIRRVRKPEPYKGKGIRYAGEAIRRKAGKAGKVGGKKK